MSFILDALKKSENDRQRQASPALFEVKVAAPRRRFPLWAVGLAVLLAINVAALVFVLLRRPEASAPTAATGNAPVPSVAANTSQPGMVTVPATVTIPTTVQIPINAAPSVSMGGPAIENGPADQGIPPLVEEPLLEGQEPAVPPDYDARDYRPAITPAQAGAIAAARRSGQLPSRDEVIAQGNAIPDLRLDLHVYAANPAERFVFLNMRKLREGESLPEGVRVEQITPTGVDLSYQGKRFALAGN
jgi:general secretion pathway protein B